MKRISEVLNILMKYDPDSDFSAEHDKIWAASSEVEITDEDLNRLEELGWFIDEEFDCWSHFC